jgi:phage FluMu protein Com
LPVSIKNRCLRCDFVIEAPEAMRGREVVCPKCEAVNLLRTAEDAQLIAAEARIESAHEKQRFLDGLSRRNPEPPRSDARRGASSAAWAPAIEQGEAQGVAVLAGARLKDVSIYLLGLAYLLLTLALLLGGVLVAGSALAPSWKAFGFLASAMVGVFLFVFLKFLSDAVRALADLADLGRSIDARLQGLVEQGAPVQVPAATDAGRG